MTRNRVWWEVWHDDTANLLADFPTRKEAVAWAAEQDPDLDVIRVETLPDGDREYVVVYGPHVLP